MKRFLFTIVLLTGLIGAGFFLFVNFVDSGSKSQVYNSFGVERGSPLREAALDTYLEAAEITVKQNIWRKWVIRGWLYNSHPTRTIDQVGIRIRFTDGNETRYISKSLNPDGSGIGKPFTLKISGHTNAQFIDWKIISAK